MQPVGLLQTVPRETGVTVKRSIIFRHLKQRTHREVDEDMENDAVAGGLRRQTMQIAS